MLSHFSSLREPAPSREASTNLLDESCRLASKYHQAWPDSPMFEQSNPAAASSQSRIRLASVLLHAAILAWVLRAPEPRLLTANSVALGQNGSSVTRLYWSSKNPDDSTHSSSDLATHRYKKQRLGQKLTWKAS